MGSDRVRLGRDVPQRVVRAESSAVAGKGATPGWKLTDLQGLVGNQAVVGLLDGAQAKLEVGAAHDPYEQEADEVASRVVASLQRQARPGGPGATTALEATTAPAATIRRRASDTGGPEVGSDGGTVQAETEAAISSARGGGRPLDSPTRVAMETAFGADFSRVRVHAGGEAAGLNRKVQAKAFTVGNDIFFRDAVPDAGTRGGQELLAHELTHTIQQGGSPSVSRSPAVIRRRIGFEIETGIPLMKRALLKKGGTVYKDIYPSTVGDNLRYSRGKLLPDHIPGKPPHKKNGTERFDEWPIVEYVTDPVDDTLKMDQFEVIARSWLTDITQIKTLAKTGPPAQTLKEPLRRRASLGTGIRRGRLESHSPTSDGRRTA